VIRAAVLTVTPTFPSWIGVVRGRVMRYLPWAFVTPSVAGAREDGKLLIDLPWDQEASFFADVIGVVVLYIEGAHQICSDEVP
jgi:hypothetical protein